MRRGAGIGKTLLTLVIVIVAVNVVYIFYSSWRKASAISGLNRHRINILMHDPMALESAAYYSPDVMCKIQLPLGLGQPQQIAVAEAIGAFGVQRGDVIFKVSSGMMTGKETFIGVAGVFVDSVVKSQGGVIDEQGVGEIRGRRTYVVTYHSAAGPTMKSRFYLVEGDGRDIYVFGGTCPEKYFSAEIFDSSASTFEVLAAWPANAPLYSGMEVDGPLAGGRKRDGSSVFTGVAPPPPPPPVVIAAAPPVVRPGPVTPPEDFPPSGSGVRNAPAIGTIVEVYKARAWHVGGPVRTIIGSKIVVTMAGGEEQFEFERVRLAPVVVTPATRAVAVTKPASPWSAGQRVEMQASNGKWMGATIENVIGDKAYLKFDDGGSQPVTFDKLTIVNRVAIKNPQAGMAVDVRGSNGMFAKGKITAIQRDQAQVRMDDGGNVVLPVKQLFEPAH